MFQYLKGKHKQDKDYPARTFELEMYRRVLEGTLYDCLQYPFHTNFKQNLGSQRTETISLCDRRPSVRYRVCKIVVDDSVSLLFGEGRFPFIGCDDEPTKQIIDDIVEDSNLNLLMTDAATKGSIGSVAIVMKVIKGRLFFENLYTEYLTPEFNKENPLELISITEQYKISGKDLMDAGYKNLIEKEIYWFKRVWDGNSETYYIPWKVTDEKASPQIDEANTLIHGLGFVPIVWIKNLPGKDSQIDGWCTFQDAIDNSIEIDYQLSQGGRGLKYSSEPLLMIKSPSLSMQGEIAVGDGNVIEVDEKGDVKHVEIDGQASHAVLEYVKMLRELALENIHGNRSSPEKSMTVQSGKAMEMMNQALIWLADKLRITYGAKGLKDLIGLIIKANQVTDLMVKENRIAQGTMKNLGLNLQWPTWFAPTSDDRNKEAQTLTTLTQGGLLSRETAVESLATEYDISDVKIELSQIKTDKAAALKDEQTLMNSKPTKPNQE